MGANPIQYETLVAEFEDGLLNALRGHGVGFDYLDIWVPDEDPVKGILNMAESAEAFGTPEIIVAVRRSTLPASRDGELLALLSPLGNASIAPMEDGVVIAVRNLGAKTLLQDLPIGLRGGIACRLAGLEHEGSLPEPHSGFVRVIAEEGTMRLGVLVDPEAGHIVQIARHSGAQPPALRAILDALCAAILGAPVDDAADHGAIRALDALRDPEQPRPVAGVLLPLNADLAFGPVVRMARAVRDDYWRHMALPRRYNEFDRASSAPWLALGAAGRLAKVEAGAAAFTIQSGLPEGTIQVLRIDDDLHGQPVRALVTFSNGIAPSAKPDAMRALERALKRDVERSIQLYHEQLKDQNAIRRL